MRTIYHSDDKQTMATMPMLCEIYGIKPEDVNCRNCNFLNLHTIDLDKKEGHCSYWKTCVRWHSFCTHFMNREGKKMTNTELIKHKGKWISRYYYRKSTDSYDVHMFVCSECGYEYSYDAETGISDNKFCPNCGASMRGNN